MTHWLAWLAWSRQIHWSRIEYARDPFAASRLVCAEVVGARQARGEINAAEAAACLAEIRRWGQTTPDERKRMRGAA